MIGQRDSVRNSTVTIAMVAVASLAAWPVLTNHGKPPLLGTLGLIAMIAGVYVGLRHPQWLFWGLAVVLGGLPFGKLPAVHAPMYLVFGAGAVLAAIVHRSQRMHITRLEIAVLALFFTGLVSLLITGAQLTAILEFIKWSVCTLTMLALLRLPPQLMKKFGQIFVWAAAFNSAFGILIWVADPNQKLLRIFKPFGYGSGGGLRSQLALFVYSDGGASQSLRLGGTWVLPNTAGLCIVAAMAMGFVLFVGWQRVVLTLIFLVAMGLTLSRSAIFSAVVALIILLLLHSMRARDRQLMLGLVGLVAIAALSTPAVRDRLLMSFGSDDTGSSARKQALIDFPPMMVGKWWFGWGWGRPEFKDGSVAQQVNMPANVPLLTIYRAGIFSGLAMMAVLIIACALSYKLMRSNSLAYALYGSIVIGLIVVALQLDKPVVDIQPVTMTFSVLLAFLVMIRESLGTTKHLMEKPPTVIDSPRTRQRELAEAPAS